MLEAFSRRRAPLTVVLRPEGGSFSVEPIGWLKRPQHFDDQPSAGRFAKLIAASAGVNLVALP
jgi:hypothetical protein